MPKKGFYNIALILIIFLFGLYICSTHTREDLLHEGFVPKGDMPPPLNKPAGSQHNCPNVLVQKGTELFLYNSRKGPIPGVNPVKFENLEEYVEFTKWLKHQNINCPILFLQKSYDSQDKPVYQFRPDPLDLHGGLPSNEPLNLDSENAFSMRHPKEMALLDAGKEHKNYNKGSYASFDESNQYIGIDTPLDKLFHEKENARLSDNPLDTNWGGAKFSRDMVKAGLYRDKEIYKIDRDPKNKIKMPHPPLSPKNIPGLKPVPEHNYKPNLKPKLQPKKEPKLQPPIITTRKPPLKPQHEPPLTVDDLNIFKPILDFINHYTNFEI
jgi:hypothetical protein